jgi:hypothetical protein
MKEERFKKVVKWSPMSGFFFAYMLGLFIGILGTFCIALAFYNELKFAPFITVFFIYVVIKLASEHRPKRKVYWVKIK